MFESINHIVIALMSISYCQLRYIETPLVWGENRIVVCNWIGSDPIPILDTYNVIGAPELGIKYLVHAP